MASIKEHLTKWEKTWSEIDSRTWSLGDSEKKWFKINETKLFKERIAWYKNYAEKETSEVKLKLKSNDWKIFSINTNSIRENIKSNWKISNWIVIFSISWNNFRINPDSEVWVWIKSNMKTKWFDVTVDWTITQQDINKLKWTNAQNFTPQKIESNNWRIEWINESDFNQLFNNKTFKQWRLWNCYLISALRSLMENNNYKKLIMYSISKVTTNNWKISKFLVKMPLWEPKWKAISIENDDINQKQYIVKNWKKVKRSWISQWSLWVKVLEAVYHEFLLWKDNWNLWNVEGWFWSIALLNLLWRENISPYNYIIPKPWKRAWFQEKAWFQKINLNYEKLGDSEMKNFLLNFNPNSDIATVWSLPKSWWSDATTYKIGKNNFYNNHAYSLLWVEKTWNTISKIKIVNPHNTAIPIYVTYEEFVQWFHQVNWGKLKSTFMNNQTSFWTVMAYDYKLRR